MRPGRALASCIFRSMMTIRSLLLLLSPSPRERTAPSCTLMRQLPLLRRWKASSRTLRTLRPFSWSVTTNAGTQKVSTSLGSVTRLMVLLMRLLSTSMSLSATASSHLGPFQRIFFERVLSLMFNYQKLGILKMC